MHKTPNPEEQQVSRHTLVAALTLFGLALLIWASTVNYLIYHALIELFSVVTAFTIGVVAWQTHTFTRNHYLLFLGCVFPWIGGLDLIHTLVYKGMHLLPSDDANPATQFWVVSRVMEGLALLIAPIYLTRPLNPLPTFLGWGTATILLAAAIFTGYFPDAFIEGNGLTTFKVDMEVGTIILMTGGLLFLLLRRTQVNDKTLQWLTLAIGASIISETAFTFYIDVFGLSNLIGHIFKLAAFWFIFLALVRTTLSEPFRQLARQVSTYDSLPDPIVVVDQDDIIRQSNRVAEAMSGTAPLIGAPLHERLHDPGTPIDRCPVCRLLALEESSPGVELHLPSLKRWQSVALSPLWTGTSQSGMVLVMHDITDKKQSEVRMRRLNRALYTLSACNHAMIHAKTEEHLLQQVCDLVVRRGGYLMAWVGLRGDDAQHHIVPAVRAGKDEGFLETVSFFWGDHPEGNCPSGQALRRNKVAYVNDITLDASYPSWRDEALQRGYASTLAMPLGGGENIPWGVLTVYAGEPHFFTEDELMLLDNLAGDLSFGVEALRNEAGRAEAELQTREGLERLTHSMEQAVEAVARTVEKRDPYTAGHQQRVAQLAVAIACEMGLSDEQVRGIRLGASIHDLGKINIPTEILTRPGKLNEYEMEIIRTHAQSGWEIMNGVDLPWPVAEMIWQHHERLDGSGYPQGLKDREILLESRIIAVADVVEAMSSHRPYRAQNPLEDALREIESHADTLYDPEVVQVCLHLFREKGFEFAHDLNAAEPYPDDTSPLQMG